MPLAAIHQSANESVSGLFQIALLVITADVGRSGSVGGKSGTIDRPA